MTPERWQRVNQLCQEAFELPEAERAAFLDTALDGTCADDVELRQQVEALLAADRDAGTFLASPALGTADTTRVKRAMPEQIDRYRLLRQLGEGGMSTVYLATRADDQVRRRVAVKVLRQGMETGDRLRRFEVERQILASLDHPNIARLLDGGTTEAGLPYLVLEYVEGEPIDEYCNRHRLTIAERVRLFQQICSAVHFAHQNMIVHRDLKPTNILVTEEGVPKLLDFGIAKLLNVELSFHPTAAPTLTWQRVLTPAYASPEQVQGKAISTASDIYSLGVLLYKLLTDRLPVRPDDLSPSQLEEALTRGELERPSQVIEQPAPPDTHDLDLATVSQRRNVRGGELRRQLAGDLDHIVAMALRVEPQRRYGSARELSEDLRRHLDGLPVVARKGTVRYQVGKFLRRNRLGVGIAAAFLVLLLTSAVSMGILALRLSDERDKAEHVADFLEQLLQASNPFEPSPLQSDSGQSPTVVELLDRGAERVDREFEEQPELRASLLGIIGNAYRSMGQHSQAEPLLESALALRREQLQPPHPDLASSLQDLATLASHRGDYARATELLEQALAMRQALFGDDHPAVASSRLEQAFVYAQQGQYAEAEAQLQPIFELFRRGVARDSVATSAFELLADLQVARGEYDAAEDSLQEALTLRHRHTDADHPASFSARARLAYVYSAQGRYTEAEAQSLELLEDWQTRVGDDHPDVASILNNLGNVYYYQGKLGPAREAMQRALEINRRFLGPDHPQIITNTHNLATLLTREGNYDQAIELHRENLQRRRRVQGDKHPRLANTLDRLAEAHALRGASSDAAEAEALYRQALEVRRELLGEHPKVAESLHNLAQLLVDQGRLETAEPLLRQAVELGRQVLGPPALDEPHPDLARYLVAYGQLQLQLGRAADAEPWLREGVDIYRRTLPAEAPDLVQAEKSLRGSLQQLDPG